MKKVHIQSLKNSSNKILYQVGATLRSMVSSLGAAHGRFGHMWFISWIQQKKSVSKKTVIMLRMQIASGKGVRVTTPLFN